TPAQLFWPPGVDDLRVVIAAGRADSLRGRSPVHGFRPGVVKVSLQAVAKTLAKRNLKSVVARLAHGPPRVERRELIVIVAIRLITVARHVEARAGNVVGHVEFEPRVRLVGPIVGL